jgi:hypothetical protein
VHGVGEALESISCRLSRALHILSYFSRRSKILEGKLESRNDQTEGFRWRPRIITCSPSLIPNRSGALAKLRILQSIRAAAWTTTKNAPKSVIVAAESLKIGLSPKLRQILRQIAGIAGEASLSVTG